MSSRVGTTAVLDVQRILVDSKWSHLAREIMQGGGAEYEADLRACALLDLAGLIQTAGEAGAFSIIVDRHHAGVLYAAPSVDITPLILEAYDAKFDRTMAQCDRATLVQQLKDHFATAKKAREAREAPTGMYL